MLSSYFIMVDFPSHEAYCYTYNVLRIVGRTLSAFLLKILHRYFVSMHRILFRDCNDSWNYWTKKCSYFTNKISFSTKLFAYLLFGSVIYSIWSLKRTYRFSMRIYNVGKTSKLFTSSIIFHLKFHGSFGTRKFVRHLIMIAVNSRQLYYTFARSVSTTVLNILEIFNPFMNLDVFMRLNVNAHRGLLCKMKPMEIR